MQRNARGSKSYQRSLNRALVLRALRARPGTSRAEVADELGLDRSTVTLIVTELVSHGLISEAPIEQPNRRVGRPPVGLSIHEDRLCAIGVEIEPTYYRAVVRGLGGQVYARLSGEAAFRSDPEGELERVLGSLVTASTDKGYRPVGIGCAVPGYVNPHTGRLVRSRSLGVEDLEIPSSIPAAENRNRIPLVLDNDANCCAWGELSARRSGALLSDILFVLVRPNDDYLGVGMGVALNGSVYYGSRYSAGEFCSYKWGGTQLSQLSIPPADLNSASRDPAVRQRLFVELLTNLIPIVSVIVPEEVRLGGFLREHYDEIRSILVSNEVRSTLWDDTDLIDLLRPSQLADDEVSSGAAGMFFERLFSPPRFAGIDAGIEPTWEQIYPLLAPAHGG